MSVFPLTGHLFDLNSLTKEDGYTVHDRQQDGKLFHMNICGNVSDAGCSPETGEHPVTGSRSCSCSRHDLRSYSEIPGMKHDHLLFS